MATSSQGISFEELENSPRIRGDSQGITAVRMFKVDWSDYQAFVGELAGLYQNIAGSIVFGKPLQFPGGNTDLLVDEVEVEPFEGSSPVGTSIVNLTQGCSTYSTGAKVTATYRQRFDNNSSSSNPTLPDGTYLTYASELGAEYMTVPGNTWHWAADSVQLPPDITPGIVIPTIHHQYTWHNVLAPPHAAISAALGCVNNGTFGGKAGGTMLFLGAKMRTAFAFSNNQTVWALEYNFSEKNQDGAGAYGWNFFYRYDTNPHWKVIGAHKSPNNTPYALYDFANLFQFA